MSGDLWPWPTDTREERRARVAWMFRGALAEAAPNACRELDAAMRAAGQHWILDEVPDHAADDLLTVNELASILDVSGDAVRKRIRRGQIARRGLNYDGHGLYRLGDLRAAAG
ncbi:hypothetical protein [Mycolicibacterium porcinum]|uniref:hypothetical protein n=1 Tax=Mycolicibacterium porcinum TaxID=39693 RepID=UPI000848589B|nr:hypothetical protein [Mycolicibacterium porcinum]ODR22126.1 hypothetical protein BHQ19_19815 [Mycolicibacterium porcinum]